MPRKYALPAEITIYTLGALRKQWLDWLRSVNKGRRVASGPVKAWPVDASRVNEVDASGIQLLLSLSNSLVAKKKNLRLINSSAALVHACHALGASALLEADNTAGNNT